MWAIRTTTCFEFLFIIIWAIRLTTFFIYRRDKKISACHGAFRLMMDDAYAVMESTGDVDIYEDAYAKVQGRLAKVVFEHDDELLRLLTSKAAELQVDGLQVSLFYYPYGQID